MTQTAAAPRAPVILQLRPGDLRDVLAAGWRDFTRAPLYGLAFSLVFVAGGWLMLWALRAEGQIWWTLPAAAGFPILGPFIACGLYEVSRRLEQGLALSPRAVFGVILNQRDRQIPAMAAVIVVFFLFWNFLAHMIFALFLGTSTMTDISRSLVVFATPEGIGFLVFGTFVGAVLSLVLFALTVISLPMLLDREVDFITAMLTSWALVMAHPVLMPLWGAIIAVLLFLAMLPGFLGLFVVLPVLGHASWHLYRIALEP